MRSRSQSGTCAREASLAGDATSEVRPVPERHRLVRIGLVDRQEATFAIAPDEDHPAGSAFALPAVALERGQAIGECLAQVRAGREFALPTVVEILDPGDVPLYEDAGVDCFQVGEPNSKNQALLNRLRTTSLPVIHKRGNSLDTEAYLLWVERVMSGGKENVMPAFGENKNVYCYMDDLYIYLRARAVDAIPRGRPPKKADKPQAAKDHEASCMGG